MRYLLVSFTNLIQTLRHLLSFCLFLCMIRVVYIFVSMVYKLCVLIQHGRFIVIYLKFLYFKLFWIWYFIFRNTQIEGDLYMIYPILYILLITYKNLISNRNENKIFWGWRNHGWCYNLLKYIDIYSYNNLLV